MWTTLFYKSSHSPPAGCRPKTTWVLQGPGENAGVIDIDDGQACIFKMSHNHRVLHPGPTRGAATTGFFATIFTMGAIAANLLRFRISGSLERPVLVERLPGSATAGTRSGCLGGRVVLSSRL